MRAILRTLTAASLLLLTLAPGIALAETFVAFGPQTFTRRTGAPVTESRSFPVRNPSTQYTLRVRNAGISSAVVMLNGGEVLGPDAFNANVGLIEVPVVLQQDNVLSVELRSAPGSSIVIEVEGVDNDSPTISATVAPLANTSGWHNADVTVAFVCDDATSPVVSCPSPVRVADETGGRVVSGEAVDAAGNRTSASVTVRLDKTPPAVTASAAPSANDAGWNNTPVTVQFVCSDTGSGVADCPQDQVVSTEGAGQTVMGTATDAAGHMAPASQVVNIDQTPPAVTLSLSPAPNADRVYAGPVTAHFECMDAGSGIESCPDDQVISTPGVDQTVSGTALDRAGNATVATSDPFTIRISNPKITLTLSPAPNGNGWNNTPVVAHFTCTPDGAPIVTCPPDQVIDTEGANQTVSGTVIDANGNTASAMSEPFSIDLTPPAVTASLTPQPNANGWHNAPVAAHFTCSDSGSGIASCPADQTVTTDGANQLLTGTATDLAGHIATTSATVSLDRAPPRFTLSSPADGTPVFVAAPAIRGTATDALSGVASAACNATPATLAAGSVDCAPPLSPGTNSIQIVLTDTAGNSSVSTLSLLYRRVPTVTLTAPAPLSYLNVSPTTVNGTVDEPTATIVVNSIPAAVVNGQFSLAVPITEGPNTITATATTVEGAVGTASLEVTLDTTPPRVTVTSPPDQFVTTDASISVAGIVNDIVVGTVNAEQAQVTVNGAVAQVANRTFLATDVPLALGTNVLQAVGRDRTGNSATTQISVTRQVVTEPVIRVVSGNNQTAAIGASVHAPLVIAVTDVAGLPVPGRSVIFKVTQNDGLVAAGDAPAPTLVATTDAQGQAQVQWTLGMRAGAGGNAVEAYSVGISGTAIFTATGTQGLPGKIVVDTGNDQIGAIGQPLPKPLIAVVVDDGNNRRGGVPVTFTAVEGGGSFDGQPSLTVTSDPDGRVAATLTLGMQEGNANNLVSVTFESNQGFPATFTASGRAPGNPAATTISGVILDNSNVPIPGVTVRAVLNEHLNAGAGSVQLATPATTDALGVFTITQAPVGVVELLVDGSTAQPTGTYPSLEYEMVTVAGQNNTVGLPIYLLPTQTANQLCVTDTTGGGTLTIPDAPGFSLTFSPGQVTFPGGSKSGCVSVTVVNREKVPMVPGFGQQPRFIVTIQPAGAVFNPPAAITLPNVDGLKPRAVTEMYSFDHDISSFIAIGTGTVSDDGQVIRSNPGVGVLKAGWHCGGDPQSRGTVADCPVCNWCQAAPPGPGGPDLCVFDPAQGGKPCNGGPYNNCIVPNTGTCVQDAGSYKGSCLGGIPQPDGTGCNAGGSQLAMCSGGACLGTGNQCPATCNPSPSPNACIVYGCNNGTCTQTPDTTCQTQCVGQADGTACNAGGLLPGACYGGQCLGSGGQCPGECSATCVNGQCENVCAGKPNGAPCGSGATCLDGACRQPATVQLTIDVSRVEKNTFTYSPPTVTAAVSVMGGTFEWFSDNPGVLSIIGRSSGPNLGSVSLMIKGVGSATVRVRYTIEGSDPVEDSATFVLSRDIAVVGWIDGSMISVPASASNGLVSALNGVLCLPMITLAWPAAGRTGTPPQFPYFHVSTDGDRNYANRFLISRSANSDPGNQIDWFFLSTQRHRYRALLRFQAAYVVKNGAIIGNPKRLAHSVAGAGLTLNPCFEWTPNLPFLPSPEPQEHMLNGTFGVGRNRTVVYMLNQARVGADSQAADTYLNDPNGTVGATTPWIFSYLEFGLDGDFTLDHQIFPSYSVYEFDYPNGPGRLLFRNRQRDLQDFINLDSSSEKVP